jgi:uncharacterized protein (TIGR03067 family)
MSTTESPGERGATAPRVEPPTTGAVVARGADAPRSPVRSRVRPLLLAAALGVLSAVAIGSTVWFVFFRGPADDLGRMQGEWVIRDDDGRERGTVRVAGDRWTYLVGGREVTAHRIELNPAAGEIDLTALEPDGRPKTFTRGATGTEMKELGVYRIDAGVLRIAKAPAWPAGARPKSLDDPDAPPALTLVRPAK